MYSQDCGFVVKRRSSRRKIDPNRHRLNAEVKAVTYHNLAVTKNDSCHAKVTLDA
ncbi:MAG: archease [Halobacteriota archaeon]